MIAGREDGCEGVDVRRRVEDGGERSGWDICRADGWMAEVGWMVMAVVEGVGRGACRRWGHASARWGLGTGLVTVGWDLGAGQLAMRDAGAC